MQKVELFKPEDFEGTYGHFQKEAHAKFAEIANKKLQEYLESCPRVFGKRGEDESIYCDRYIFDGYNFIAKLLVIKEIHKEPEKEKYIDSGVKLNGTTLYRRELS